MLIALGSDKLSSKRSPSVEDIPYTSLSLGELQGKSHQHRSLRTLSSGSRDDAQRLWDEFYHQDPWQVHNPRHQSASSRDTQASTSSAFSDSTIATTVNNSLQGSRDPSQDVDPDKLIGTEGSAMIARSIRKLDILKRDALTTPTLDNSLQQSHTTSQYLIQTVTTP